jgi:calcineurin-like phosphoesterase
LEGSFPGFGYYRFSKNLTPLPIPPHEGEGKKSSPFLDEQGEGRMKNQQFLVINLHGQVFCEKFFDGKLGNPFWEVDKLLKNEAQKGDIIFIDFHAEATSEKKTLGFYVDGRVSVVVGTHTHVATADAHIMKNGTAYVSDVGMTGSRDSALGVKFENALVKFLDPNAKFVNELEETGVMGINGVFVEIGGAGKAVKVEKLYEEIS